MTLKAAVLVAVCGIVLASCGPDAVEATPQETVAGWLGALDGPEDPGDYVIEGQVSLMAALGRSADADDIVSDGLSAESEAAYWASLASGISATAGVPASQLAVGDTVVLALDGVDNAFVDVVGGGGTTVVVVRMEGDPLIDLIATTGPELVRPLATLLSRLDSNAFDGPAIAASLRVGLSEPNLDLPPEFYGEVQDLIGAIDG